MRYLSVFLLLLLTACVTTQVPSENAPLELKPASFSDLPGWKQSDASAALTAFEASCRALTALPPDASIGPDPLMGHAADYRAPCQAAQTTSPANAAAFFVQWFQPYQATAAGNETGLFTGYYEAALKGSRIRHGAYRYPLRLRPADLISVDLGDFRPSLKGQRLAGRVVGHALKPYPDRANIRANGLPDDAHNIFVWVDDPVDAFFLQVQGSGRIEMDDGSSLRVGYDGQNGWPYTAIGKALIHRGDLTSSDVSMQSIRAWLHAHPDEMDAVMDTDRSYIFFRELSGNGPLGGEGVTLTSGASLAVDRGKIGYGIPTYVAAGPVNRLMVAQDTGGAIVGAVRGDVFFGYGPDAASQAGAMKASGKMWLLLPKR